LTSSAKPALRAAPRGLKGKATPRLFTPPLRPLNRRTSDGYDVADFAEKIGKPLLPWQRWVAIHALELLPDGTYRFRKVVILVARQNGKSDLKRTITLWRMYHNPKLRVLGLAQELDLAKEQWQLCQDTIEDDLVLSGEFNPARKIGRLRNINGQETFWLANGARYKIKASNRKAGRGGSNDEVNIDELREQRDWKSWAAVSKTTMARPNSQIWAMSNAGDDESVVLNQLRDSALHGRDETIGLFEYSGEYDDESDGYCPIDDWQQIAQANPGLGHIISARAIASDMASDPPEIFRCLDVSTPVLTACGTMPIDRLQAGDAVKGTSGEWVNVVGASETHVGRDCYRVTLNDGRSIVCDAGHLWTVRDRRRPRPAFETLRTTDLISRGVTYHHPSMNFDVRNFSLPPVAPLDGPDVDLPVHPYLLGLWLGDGSRRSATICAESRDADHIAARMEASGATITTRAPDSAHCERIGFRVGRHGAFIRALRSLGIYPQMPFRKALASDFRKFVPDIYLTASLAQRLDLLRGLMDSDGTVTAKSGRCCFVNTNTELIAGVRTLVRSLGWKTSELEAGQYGKSHHLPRLSVDFTPRPDQPCPVTLPRKAERIRAARGPRDVRPTTIASIEPVASVPVRCIKVDAPDSLFLAGDLVPTHNTEVMCQRVRHLDSAIDMTAWGACADPAVTMDSLRSRLAACFDVAPDDGHATLAVAAKTPEGKVRGEIAASWPSAAAARLELAPLLERMKPSIIAWYPSGPAASLAPVFRAPKGRPVKLADAAPGRPHYAELTGGEVCEACMGLASLVKGRMVLHPNDPLLNSHLGAASRLKSGDGWRFARKAATGKDASAGTDDPEDDDDAPKGHVDAAYAFAGAAHEALLLPEPRPARIRVLSA
jgi:hypothetical protein